MAPPNYGMCPDKDSGNENDATVDNLSGNQLRASTEFVAFHANVNTQQVGELDVSDDEETNDDFDIDRDADEAKTSPHSPKERPSMQKHCRQWKKADIPTGLPTQRQ